MLWWQADHAEALWRAGRRHEAERALKQFDDDVARAGGPAAEATAARCRGLLAEDEDVSAAAFARAFALHAQVTIPFELGRLLLCRAERAISNGDAAHAVTDLDEAAAIFDVLAAAPWRELVDVVRGRLADASGAEDDLLAELTPAELRVARAVSRGLSNREVATELFLSVKTVDFHLQRIYRKLDVRSRTVLAVLVTDATR
jgi:DNA-binding NarL/FixJ family response regulator